MNKFFNKQFTSQYRATIGADFSSQKLQIEDQTILLNIWDTAGQERFQSLGTSFFRGTDCCIVVFDITSQKSFDRLNYWISHFIDSADPPDPFNYPFIILGNKSDLVSSRQVSTQLAQKWCKCRELYYWETSAKDNTNIENVKTQAIQLALIQNKKKEDFHSHKFSHNLYKYYNRMGCC